jgi:GT2 family glycosyltransferase
MVDDDVYLEDDCLQKLVAVLEETDAAVAVPRLALCPETDIIQLDGADAHFIGTMTLRNGRASRATTPAARIEVGGFSTSCLLITREVFRAAEGFDAGFFFHFEDLELSIRLRALGHKIVCDAHALAFHDRGVGTPGLSFRDRGIYPRRRAYLTMRNRLQILILHYRLRVLALMFPALLLYEMASLAFAIRNRVGGEWVRAWAWQLRHARILFSRRGRMRRKRVVEELALLVGGPLPLAVGLTDRPMLRGALGLLSAVLDTNWRIVCLALGTTGEPSVFATARVGHGLSERDH